MRNISSRYKIIQKIRNVYQFWEYHQVLPFEKLDFVSSSPFIWLIIDKKAFLNINNKLESIKNHAISTNYQFIRKNNS